MRPEDLDLLLAVGPPSLTPDGRLAVVSVIRPDLESDSYRGGLWVVPTDGAASYRLTNGERDTAPAVSPDGRRVAFLRGADGSPAQLHLTSLAGGEPLRLTDHPLGAAAAQWSPDGTRLAYTARIPEAGRYGTEDAEGRSPGPDAEPARLVTELSYRLDDLGFTRDRRPHVFVLDVPAEGSVVGEELPTTPVAPRQLTDGDVDDHQPTWSPDGKSIAFLSARHGGREQDLRSGVHLVPADETDETPVPSVAVEADLTVSALAWWPDGRLVLVATDTGADGRDFVGRPGRLWVSEGPVGPGSAAGLRSLTGEDVDLEGGPGSLVACGDQVVVREVHRGAVRLLAVDPDASGSEPAPEVLVDGEVVVAGQAASADGTTLVVSAGDPARAGDVAVVQDGSLEWRSDVGVGLRDAGLVTPIEREASSEDGYPVHGWVLLPDAARFGPGPHPVLLTIHGGPHSHYDWALFDEAQVYAGAGYAVVMCNPRGSAGYGFEHGRSIRHAMGTVDADDVLTFLDAALDESGLALDAERVGVMGGSYGGYLTALLTTRTDRFAAAIVERGYLDATSFVGSSDIGWFFPGEYHGDAAAAAEQSPLTHVDRVTTPTLVIHSESDWRTPVEQGQRWFTALRSRGVPTELLLFPGEGHELSRSGRPRHRRQRFEHILRWWAEHLPVVRER